MLDLPLGLILVNYRILELPLHLFIRMMYFIFTLLLLFLVAALITMMIVRVIMVAVATAGIAATRYASSLAAPSPIITGKYPARLT